MRNGIEVGRRGGPGFGWKISLIWKEAGEEGKVRGWNASKKVRQPDVL